MENTDLLDQVRKFKLKGLKRVSTTVTSENGVRYTETLKDDGCYETLPEFSLNPGFVIDNSLDITVSLVLEGLILGSQDVAMELKILEDFNVTHVLNIGYKIPNYYESKFIYKNVDILDEPKSNIRTFFDGCFEFIDDGRHEGCVLVHCNAGVSRAPTIVIAYLMKTNHMALKEAFNFVKSIRPYIRPNDGFMRVLEDYEKEIFA
ncbi:dual specificity protein phosphatase 19 isoform X2 [Parasteatoda tepidariorum]|nr:dual specificity protein phosphatase 19 [Parasteatoda tepidariorum]XP_042894923.1 dual specificity protein phosphatase 19 [Parasteatoda tepidariorum]XP_042894925.1 dual specificity protein phosphatase 19 [Parasteatoda tepidariorum]XP_042894926.1 dual specificity protein phosphatase 19 [Parasteatoda tepidariorum]XP_042894927.1 dual specificity protein phosphatase 19 [Parasteatoda tepidariorum]